VGEVKVESAAKLSPRNRQLLDEKEPVSGNAARIVAAWGDLEEIVRRRLARDGVDSGALSASDLLRAAMERNLITDIQKRSLSGLNAMRNLAVHGQSSEIDDRRTHEFLNLAHAMKTVLDITER
jgi:hypothetical protein